MGSGTRLERPIAFRPLVFDFGKLTRGEWIAGGGGVALLVVMLVFKWYGVKETGVLLTPGGQLGTREGLARNAFESFTFVDLVLLLTALSAIALALLGASERVPSLPVPLGLLVGALGAISILIVIRIISPPDLANTVGGEHVRVSDFPNTSVTRKIGVWLGLIATGLVAYGGFTALREQ